MGSQIYESNSYTTVSDKRQIQQTRCVIITVTVKLVGCIVFYGAKPHYG